MPDYTIETSHRVPVYRHRTYQADTVTLACRQAIEDDDWSSEKLSYEDAGESYISGIWNGVDAAYSGQAIPVPSHFSETIERKVRRFEILLGLLKLLLADVQAGQAASDDWIERAVSAVARGEAILAGARDPDDLAQRERL